MSKTGGLAGLVAGDSAIATVGLGSGLNYRGFNIVDLAKNTIFEEVAHLLLIGHLPNREELRAFSEKIASQRSIPQKLIQLLESVPASAHPMDVMRTICSYMGLIEPE